MTAMDRRRTGLAVLAASLMGMGTAVLAGAEGGVGTDLALPEMHGRPGWFQAQRTRYATRALWQQALSAIGRGDDAAAHKLLREILASAPANNHARIYLVAVCGRLGKPEEGITLCDELLALYPDYAEGYLNKAYLAVRAGKPALALQAFDALLQRPGLDIRRRLQALQDAAELCLKSGQPEQALRYGRLWLAAQDGLKPRLFLIEVCRRNGKPEEGLALCSELLARYPDYAEGYLDKAYLATQAGKPDLALQTFDDLLQRPGLDSRYRLQALQDAAELSLKSGRPDQATRYGRQWAVAQDGLKPRLFLIECAVRQQQWAEALDQVERAAAFARDEPTRGELALRKAYVLVALGRHRDADEALMQARDRLPGAESRLAIERQLGFNAAVTTNPAMAAVHFKAYLLEAFDEAVARGYLDAVVASGQWELALAEARPMLKRDALTPEFREYLQCTVMYANTHLGNWLAAYLGARQLSEQTGKAPYLLDSAACAEHLQEYDEAARLYRAYLDRATDPAATLAYHYLLKRLGRSAESAPDLQKVIDLPTAPADLRYAALYELAQVRREENQPDRYFELMGVLLKEKPESSFLHEYAVQLYGAGRHEQASALFVRYYEAETNPVARAAAGGVLADISLALARPKDALLWLDRAAKLAPKDDAWSFRMARTEYALGEYRACVDRLLPLASTHSIYHLYLGFSFYKLKMPGLSLLHLNRVANPDALSLQDRFTLYSNRAYLQFDQDQDQAALDDLNAALACQEDPDLEMVRLKTLTRLGRHTEAIDTGSLMYAKRTDTGTRAEVLRLLKDHPDEAFRQRLLAMLHDPEAAYMAEVCQTVGVSAFRLGHQNEAVEWFTRALDYEPGRIDTYYLRGLAWFKKDRFKESEQDFVTFYDRADKAQAVPNTFWGDLGILEGKMKDFDLGTAALANSVKAYEADVDSMRETGYQYMKWNHNREARAAFAQSIDFYSEVVPYLEGTNAEQYVTDRRTMRKEYTKLDKTVGLQAYISKTDLDAKTQGAVPVIQTIDGSLPSQAGIMGTYRPPKIGFRNERQLDVYGRLMANFEPHSWRLNEDSYQGGAGAVYKPFISQNFNTSIERLFKIGDDSENNWLWRNMGFWERGEAPKVERSWWLYNKAYAEISYFLEDTKRWIYFIDGRLGPSFPLRHKTTLTVPRLMAVARYQSNDETGLGTYVMIGAGANLRVLEQERQYTTERWYIDFFADYVVGWFDETPQGYEGNDFHGVVFGFNFVK
jgi:tetratricopeptide (TPR) repeat protein/predicted Zn-dependent protease